jgi:glucosamine--fructose-6-phosphate aminotransferase (isomerizing)
VTPPATSSSIERIAFDGTPLPVTADDLTRSAITTRDIDRGDYPHYLLKEISESPRSFRKTLRGRIVSGDDGRLQVRARHLGVARGDPRAPAPAARSAAC